jgi:Ca2+-transporting ATPase
MNMALNEFYRLSPQEVTGILKTDISAGLDEAEVQKRFAESGPNELKASARVSPWVLFFSQFKDILIQILLVATLLSAFMGHAVESIAIAIIVLFAVVFSFIQEHRAERAIEALRRMAAPTAKGNNGVK